MPPPGQLRPVADPDILERGGKTMHQARRILSQMYTTNFMPFKRERGLIEKKSEPLGGRRPHRPP